MRAHNTCPILAHGPHLFSAQALGQCLDYAQNSYFLGVIEMIFPGTAFA